MAEPKLARQAVALLQSFAELLFFLPIGSRKLLTAPHDDASAFGALSHAAAIGQMRIRKLLDSSPDHEIGVFLYLALMYLAVLVQYDFWHSTFSC
jgi:hypothetical protein